MALEVYSTQIIEGQDLILPIKWTVKDTGLPVDLTGGSIFFDAKRPDFDMPAIITDAAEGEYTFKLDAVATAGKVTSGGEINLDYLVKYTNSLGEIDYIYKMKVKVTGANE
jgi:hypothetical protein